jgi:protein-tyrosine phosphatase
VVFLCTGNRARSPLALELFRRHTLRSGIRLSSFGTDDLGPVPALPEAVAAGDLLGVDLTTHRARAIVTPCLGTADLVVGFEPFHVAFAIVEGGAAAERTFTLPELVGLLEGGSLPVELSGLDRARSCVAEAALRRAAAGRRPPPSLADPLGQPQRAFVRLAREIDVLTARLAEALLHAGVQDREGGKPSRKQSK